MFKKPLKVSTHNLLGGKDKKSLKKELSTIFHVKSVEHFLDANEKFYCDKMQGSKVVVYSTETYPAIVDSTGKGAFFPTLYLMQAYPKMLEPVYINPGVSNFIMNGANLMWPGVKNPDKLSEFKADDLRVVISDNNTPIAIGAMGCSLAEMKANNLQGVAMYILHILDDKLWETGPKKPLEVVFSGEEKKVVVEEKKIEEKIPEKKEEKKVEDDEEEENDEEDLANLAALVKKGKKTESDEPILKAPAGKKEKKVIEQVVEAPKKAEKEVFSDEEDDKKKKGKKKGKKGGKEKEEVKKEVKPKEKEQKKGVKKGKNEEDNEDEEVEDDEEKKEEREEEDDGEKEKGGEPAIPVKIMDEYIYEAFMNAIRMSVTEKDLPMDASAFYSSHMLMCKKENIMIDLKNSSYKKIGKFYQTMAKLGLIEYKEAKKGTSPQISKINRSHEKYEKWEPTIGKVGSKKVEEEKKVSDEKWPKVVIEELFKPRDTMKAIFADEKEKKADNLYTHEEIKNVLSEYIKKNCKVEKKFIKMDPLLCSLYGTTKIEPDVAPAEEKPAEKHEDMGEEGGEDQKKAKRVRQSKPIDQLMKEELFQRFEDDLQKYHRIINLETKKAETRPGNFKGISVTAEKAHNKNITKIVGLEQFCIDLSELSSKFQLKFACSVSTHELPGKFAGKELVVHGNFLQDIVDYFGNECKVDKKHIVSHNKLEKKKK